MTAKKTKPTTGGAIKLTESQKQLYATTVRGVTDAVATVERNSRSMGELVLNGMLRMFAMELSINLEKDWIFNNETMSFQKQSPTPTIPSPIKPKK